MNLKEPLTPAEISLPRTRNSRRTTQAHGVSRAQLRYGSAIASEGGAKAPQVETAQSQDGGTQAQGGRTQPRGGKTQPQRKARTQLRGGRTQAEGGESVPVCEQEKLTKRSLLSTHGAVTKAS